MESIYIPKEAYAIKPTDDYVFITFPKIGSQRIIFAFVPLKPNEEKALEDFRTHCKLNNIKLPSWIDDDKRIALRILQGNHWNIKKSVKSAISHAKWRESEIQINEDLVRPLLPYGLMYFFGRDAMYRPVLIICLRKLLDLKIDENAITSLLLYVIEWGLKNLFIDGKVEAYSVIVDITKVGLTEVPVKLLKKMVEILQENYRGRMYRFYAFNTPFLIGAIYKIIKPLLEKFTQQKINIIGNDLKKILETVPESQLEERFGGKAPNQTVFLPPK